MEKQIGGRQSNRQRLNIWNYANLLEVMWSQLMGDTRRQSPIMLVWGPLARLHLSWPWSLALLYKCVCERRARRERREGETDYERWRREWRRTKSLCCDCLLNDGSCRLIKSFFFYVFSLFSPTDTSSTLLLLPHREAEINILTCVIHH